MVLALLGFAIAPTTILPVVAASHVPTHDATQENMTRLIDESVEATADWVPK